MYKTALITLITGSVLFLIAAFWPISRVFAERSAEVKLEIIMNSKFTWDIMQVLFGAGALIAAIGVGLLAYHFREFPNNKLLVVSSALLIAGSLFWIWHLYLRTVDPSSFAYGLQPWWHFAVYTILTQAAIAVIGYYLLQSPYPNWIGWMFLIGMGVLFVLTLIIMDMPPFVYYIFIIIAAVALLQFKTQPKAVIPGSPHEEVKLL